MAIAANTQAYGTFRQSINDFSIDEIENLYKDCKMSTMKSRMKMILTITSIALSVILSMISLAVISTYLPGALLLSGSLLGAGLCIVIWKKVNSFLQVRKDMLNGKEDELLKERVIGDFLRERGKKVIFQSYFFGFGGFSSKVIDV